MSRLTTIARRMGHRPWFAAVSRRILPPVDRWLLRRTRGRRSVSSQLDLPCLLLTTTGRKSGQARTQPLLYINDGDGYVVIGSNWGQQHHPAWTANLLADPSATVTVADRVVAVHAVLATGTERERLRELLIGMWPAYQTYERRAAGRELRIFRLGPA
jgi:deazaflavin-dependent oxidoreductase (nitroreductase family)